MPGPSRRRLALAVPLCAIALAACGGGSSSGEGGDGTPAPAAANPGCERVAAPKPRAEGDLPRPTARLEAGETTVAKVETTCGAFEIALDDKRAPLTGGAFASRAREGFYDGLAFHRVVAGFVIQAGDPLGTGEGGPGYTIEEAPPDDLTYGKGVVAMAKTETEPPGTSGSQFFVVTADDAQLPPDYALLGRVTRGMDVVERIGAVETDAGDVPVSPVVIRSIRIETEPAA
jgi:peptidyl-prolyl cis-trans isomerase B (cyclophilin B)